MRFVFEKKFDSKIPQISLKHNHIGQLQEVIVAPYVEFALVNDIRDNIGFYYINVCFGNTFL